MQQSNRIFDRRGALGAPALAIAAIFGASASALAPTATSPAHASPAAPQRTGRIAHVVIVFQENRSFDNLFNGFPGADTVQSGTDSNGKSIALRPVDLAARYDLDHSHRGFVTEYNHGAMNGFDNERVSVPRKFRGTEPANAAYAFVPPAQIQPYWSLAKQYALADRMFQTNQGPSFPAHQYIISGTAAIDASNKLYAMNNPNDIYLGPEGGCDSTSTTTVSTIDPLTGATPSAPFPCYDHPVLMDLLDAAGVSWRYYQARGGAGLWNGPNAIKHLRDGPQYQNVVWPNTKILDDISNGSLPAVSWVMPTSRESDHPNVTDGSGPAWVARIVDTLGKSRYWNDTAIFITWDDWGGFYDHVSPPQYNYYELGFRVPLIVVSPYAKHGYVSHVAHEFGSILKFTEKTFGLPSLHYTDARADDLSDMFDFGQTPQPFSTIAAAKLSVPEMTQVGNPDDDF